MPMQAAPRLLIGGLSGGSGKSLVSLALLLQLRRAGVGVRAFKKGPDYIDPAWLSWASGTVTRNLDTFLVRDEALRGSFARHAIEDGVNLIEGNRGLYDGVDAEGTHSSAALARLLAAPVLLVLDVTKMTATAAALVLGCKMLDPRLDLRGVILNNVGGKRHEQVLRAAIEQQCSIPVVGALPRLKQNPLPERHLGLIPPEEAETSEDAREELLKAFDGALDLAAICKIARSAPGLERPSGPQPRSEGSGLRIGVVRDAAFTFYYPENLEALRAAGADLVRVCSLQNEALPDGLDALYIGGGFPETHAARIAGNRLFLLSLRKAAAAGLPIYAECGGLMLLARTLSWRQQTFAMAGALALDVEVCERPQGHGYAVLAVDADNAFYPRGAELRGHEFHYSRIAGLDVARHTACAVLRGAGCGQGRDGIVEGNIFAAYTHVHALGTPEWAAGLLRAAALYRMRKSAAGPCDADRQ